VVVEQLGTSQFSALLLNRPIKRHLSLGSEQHLKVLTEVANVSNLHIQLPDQLFKQEFLLRSLTVVHNFESTHRSRKSL